MKGLLGPPFVAGSGEAVTSVVEQVRKGKKSDKEGVLRSKEWRAMQGD